VIARRPVRCDPSRAPAHRLGAFFFYFDFLINILKINPAKNEDPALSVTSVDLIKLYDIKQSKHTV
jgi:hypothetical protein